MHPKIIGAFVVGFSLIAGAYTLSNFGLKSTVSTNAALYQLPEDTIKRQYVSVTDNDANGIEDWREEFVSQTPLTIDSTVAGPVQYTIPDTLTDQVGIQLFQNVLQAKGRGNVGPQSDQVVTNTADLIRETAITDYVYKIDQIEVIGSGDEATRTYANTLGQILINNNVSGSEDEIVIIDRAMRTENPSELNKLEPLITMYKNLRDQTLATPVPIGFEKQHLDLVNVYNAMYATLDGMKLAMKDPVVALLRIQRYQDDAKGLSIGLQNMYLAFRPHVNLFSQQDPASVFLAFSPR